MTSAQHTFYFSLWGKLRKLQPAADRHALHELLGLPASHKDWSNAHFDTFKAHVLSLTDAELPGDEAAKRAQWTIDTLLAALGEGGDYAETIVRRMNSGGKLGGKGRTLDSLTGEQLRGVAIALDREVKRRFPTPEAVIAAIREQADAAQLDEAAIADSVCRALRLPAMPALASLGMDRLFLVLATVRRLSACPF